MSPPPPQCDWQANKKKLNERGQYLLETGTWGDCRFIVGTEPNQQIMDGHKLFLAMSSPVFEAMFFGGMAESNPIAILDVQPEAFKALLEYIYTDKINLTSFDQACELCYGAKKYILPHLVEECTKFLWSDLYAKNACRAYEFAKLFEEPILMEKCLHIISTKTQQVLSESSFDDIELATLITIFSQEVLNIDSELELFNALARYAGRQCQGPCAKVPRLDFIANATTEGPSRTPTIRDVLMKIRFLTMTPQQFAEGPAASNLISEREKFAILMNISSPNTDVLMPDGFSTSVVARKRKEKPFQGACDVSNEQPKKLYCIRQLLDDSLCVTHGLDSDVSFTCDRNVCVYGIQIPTQINTGGCNATMYNELIYAHLMDADGSRLTYTHFTSRVAYSSLIDISFNRPIYIQKNKMYKVCVSLSKSGCYPIGEYPTFSACSGAAFSFGQDRLDRGGVHTGFIRSIIYSIPQGPSGSSNGPSAGIPGDLNVNCP